MYREKNIGSGSLCGIQTSVAGSGITLSNAIPKTVGQVERELGNLQERLTVLITITNDLENRLYPIMRNEPESDCIEKSSGISYVPTALVLAEHVDKVNMVINRISSVLTRLEL